MPRYIRGDFAGFRALGVRKVDALLPILRRGVHVVLSDVDCVWLHDPNPMVRGLVPGYEDFANADLIVSTDCHNPQSDYDSDGCFGDLLDKNTGVMAIRATPNGIASMAEWRVRLAMGLKDEQDQTTFMDLVDGNGRGHRWGMTPTTRAAFKVFARGFCGPNTYVKGYATRITDTGTTRLSGGLIRHNALSTTAAPHTAGSRRIYNVCLPNVTTDLRLGIFPITEVANGHTFFVQQLQTMTARWPMAVHATFQYGDMPDYAFGKRQRFRDWGMWLVDDEAYTSSTNPTPKPTPNPNSDPKPNPNPNPKPNPNPNLKPHPTPTPTPNPNPNPKPHPTGLHELDRSRRRRRELSGARGRRAATARRAVGGHGRPTRARPAAPRAPRAHAAAAGGRRGARARAQPHAGAAAHVVLL